jgi:hypothetical protein
MYLTILRKELQKEIDINKKPDLSFADWVFIVTSLMCFEHVIEEYNKHEYPEYLEMGIEDLLKEYERVTGREIL